jgi:hypothetical protein
VKLSAPAWREAEKQAALERLRLRRVDMEALPQGPSKAILLRAVDDVIADIVFREGNIKDCEGVMRSGSGLQPVPLFFSSLKYS